MGFRLTSRFGGASANYNLSPKATPVIPADGVRLYDTFSIILPIGLRPCMVPFESCIKRRVFFNGTASIASRYPGTCA